MSRKKVTIAELHEKKQRQQKITMVTAYDYLMARIPDQAGKKTQKL